MIEQTISLREAHRCIKIWRALWRKLAALGYGVRDADPALGITNRAAKTRSAAWSRAKSCACSNAWREGYYGLAAVIAVMWSTQQSLGGVRALRAAQLVADGTGAV